MSKPESKKKRRSIVLGDTALSITSAIETAELGDGFSASVNGLIVTGQPELERWPKVGRDLRVYEKGAPFALGDFVNELEARFGEASSNVIDESEGWSLKTVSNYSWIAKRITHERRRMDRLGIRHHQIVAALTATQQTKWLKAAANDHDEKPWTVARLKKAIDEGEDLKVTGFYIVVKCKTEAAREKLMKKLELDGFDVKARDSRRRKALEPNPESE